jgi:hypothetical protein
MSDLVSAAQIISAAAEGLAMSAFLTEVAPAEGVPAPIVEPSGMTIPGVMDMPGTVFDGATVAARPELAQPASSIEPARRTASCFIRSVISMCSSSRWRSSESWCAYAAWADTSDANATMLSS